MKQHLIAPDGSMVVVVEPGEGRVIPKLRPDETIDQFWSRLHGSATVVRIAVGHDGSRKVITMIVPNATAGDVV